MVLIAALKPALRYLETVATTPGYENDEIAVMPKPKKEFTDQDWQNVPESEKPSVQIVDAEKSEAGVEN
jgi:hypothetical protein